MTSQNGLGRRRVTRCRRWHGDERAASTVEMVMLLPVAMLAVAVLAWAGRGPSAAGETVAAANAAARAASLAADQASATAAVQSMQTTISLDACQTMSLEIDASRWNAGWVSVEATCVPKTHGLEQLGVDDPIVRRSVEHLQQWGTRGG